MASSSVKPPDMGSADHVMVIHGVDITFMILTVMTMGLRLWSRLTAQGGGLWWDDGLALAGGAFAVIEGIIILDGIDLGFGGPGPFVAGGYEERKGLKLFYAGLIVFGICVALVKYSCLMFYARIFGGNRRFRICLWVVGTIMLSWVAATLLLVFQCSPIDKYWFPDKPGKCMNYLHLYDATAALDAVLDLILLIIPLPMIWSLAMSKNRKILVTGVFICGYGTLLTSLGRLIATIIDCPSMMADPEWNCASMILWTICEAYLSVISINLPSCFQLYKRATKKGIVALFARDTYAENAYAAQRKSTVYSRDAYGFSPTSSTFASKAQDSKSGRTSYVSRFSALHKHAFSGDDIVPLGPMSPVEIRKDVTVTERAIEHEEESQV